MAAPAAAAPAPAPAVVLVVGDRRTGKTTLIRRLVGEASCAHFSILSPFDQLYQPTLAPLEETTCTFAASGATIRFAEARTARDAAKALREAAAVIVLGTPTNAATVTPPSDRAINHIARRVRASCRVVVVDCVRTPAGAAVTAAAIAALLSIPATLPLPPPGVMERVHRQRLRVAAAGDDAETIAATTDNDDDATGGSDSAAAGGAPRPPQSTVPESAEFCTLADIVCASRATTPTPPPRPRLIAAGATAAVRQQWRRVHHNHPRKL
jgi:molybdopterin-guanine dinucleotide biosynthesis protein